MRARWDNDRYTLYSGHEIRAGEGHRVPHRWEHEGSKWHFDGGHWDDD